MGLVWCSSRRPLCLGPQVTGSPQSAQMQVLAQSFHILQFYASSAKLLARTWDRLMGRFTSRPLNGLPPRSCVIYVRRALACFCPRQRGALSSDPLSLPQPARYHRVEMSKSSPERVRATSLKLLLLSFFESLNNSTGKKAASLPRADWAMKRDHFYF